MRISDWSSDVCSSDLLFFECVQQRPSFLYGIFNPMGPTWNLFTLAGRTNENTYLLCHRMLNPFASENMIWGSIPTEAAEEEIVATQIGRDSCRERVC